MRWLYPIGHVSVRTLFNVVRLVGGKLEVGNGELLFVLTERPSDETAQLLNQVFRVAPVIESQKLNRYERQRFDWQRAV